MMEALIARAIPWWQPTAPHVRSTTRRSLGFGYIPQSACPALAAFPSPRWQVVHARRRLGWASSIPRSQVVPRSAGAAAPSRSQPSPMKIRKFMRSG